MPAGVAGAPRIASDALPRRARPERRQRLTGAGPGPLEKQGHQRLGCTPGRFSENAQVVHGTRFIFVQHVLEIGPMPVWRKRNTCFAFD